MANPIYQTTSVNSLKGYINYAISILKQGESVPVIKLLSGGGSVELGVVKPRSAVNKKAIETLMALAVYPKLDIKKYRIDLKEIKIELNQIPWDVSAANIVKSGERVPKGYFAETILQAAIAARFIDARPRSTAVTAAMVVKHLKQFLTEDSLTTAKSKAVVRAYEYMVDNEDKSLGKDMVYVLYTLNEAAFKYLQSKVNKLATDPDIMPFITDSLKYVNSGAAVEHSDYFYSNGRVDRIDIKSLGISGQGKTKADIRTFYYEGYSSNHTGTNEATPHQMSLNLSVKINHIKQIGQLTGITSDKLSELATVIGSRLSAKTIKEIDKIVDKGFNDSNKELNAGKEGQIKIYSLAYNDMKNNIGDVSKLFKGIEHFIALSEATSLNIVDIGSGLRVYFVKNLKNLEKACKGDKITAELKASTGGNYTMKIYAGNKEILEYSSRFTGGVYRNFVSTGEALRQTLERI